VSQSKYVANNMIWTIVWWLIILKSHFVPIVLWVSRLTFSNSTCLHIYILMRLKDLEGFN